MFMMQRAGSLFVLSLLLVGVVVAQARFDVVKTGQGWEEDLPVRKADFQALVVRDGFVTSAFSIETSVMDALVPSFMRLPRAFFGPFTLYEEEDPVSRFVVASSQPVAVTGYGVVDSTGALSMRDPFLGVSAAYNRYNTTDGETFLYHLELAYECKEHGAERFVAVQLRQSPEAPAEAGQEKQVTFLLRKTCPVPPSETDQQLLAFFMRPSMRIVISSSDDRFNEGSPDVCNDRPPAQEESDSTRGERPHHPKKHEYGASHEKHHKYQDNVDELVTWLNNMPEWLKGALKTSLLTGLVAAVIMLAFELLRGINSEEENDEEAAGDEVEPLLNEGTDRSDEAVYQLLPQEPAPKELPINALMTEVQEPKPVAAAQEAQQSS